MDANGDATTDDSEGDGFGTQEQLRLLATVVDHVRDAVMITTADLAEPGPKIVYVNPAFEAMSGYAAAAVLGRSPRLFQGPLTDHGTMDRLWDTLAHGLPFSGEAVGYRSDGSSYIVAWTVTPVLDEAAQITHFVSLQRDVTADRAAEGERLALQQGLLATQRLESLGRLAGGLAHDFNNLLMAILGNTELAQREAEPGAPTQEHLRALWLAARSAADLTRQLLAYAGRGPGGVGPVDVNTLVVEMAQLLRSSVTRAVPLRYELGAQLPATNGDAGQLRQVVVNLVTNAAEAVGDTGGDITLRTRVRVMDALGLAASVCAPTSGPGTYLELSVSDTGIGMDETTLAQIFRPFFTTKFTGRGLGLAAVEDIVRTHGGGLLARSTAGKGTTISVLLPASPVPMPDFANPAPLAPLVRRAGMVLVIDDDPAVRHVANSMLEQLGHRPLLAASGPDGIALVQNNADAIACVLLDLTMPRMDGAATYKAIRRIASDVPVVLMSGYHELHGRSRFEGTGLAGFLNKPFTLSALQGLLVHVIEL